MIAELTILPLGEGAHLSGPLAEVIDMIESSGLAHQVTAMGTLIEGDPEAVWELVRRCHEVTRRGAPRVITEVRIDDGASARLGQSVASLESRLGREVQK